MARQVFQVNVLIRVLQYCHFPRKWETIETRYFEVFLFFIGLVFKRCRVWCLELIKSNHPQGSRQDSIRITHWRDLDSTSNSFGAPDLKPPVFAIIRSLNHLEMHITELKMQIDNLLSVSGNLAICVIIPLLTSVMHYFFFFADFPPFFQFQFIWHLKWVSSVI